MGKRRLWIALGLLVMMFALWGGRRWFAGDGERADGSVTSTKSGVAGSVVTALRARRAKHGVVQGAIYARGLGSIAGKVVDDAGRGVVGARVCAMLEAAGLRDKDSRDPACVLSQAAGEYRIEKLWRTRYRVTASKAAFIPGRYTAGDNDTVELREHGEVVGIDIALARGGVPVRGRVLDITGGFVADALVVAGVSSHGVKVFSVYVRADADGRFELWLPKGEFQLGANADGYTDSRDFGTAPTDGVEVLMTPASTLVGRVIDSETKQPLHGVQVALGREILMANGTMNFGIYELLYDISDDAGRFTFSRLPPGRFTPKIESFGLVGQATGSVGVGLGETSREVIVEARRAAAVSARVLDNEDMPCKSGRVSLTERTTDIRKRADIRNGSVVVDAVLPGTYGVWVTCDGYIPQSDDSELVVTTKDIAGVVWRVSE